MMCCKCLKNIEEGELVYFKEKRTGAAWFHKNCDEIEIVK